MCYMDDTLRDLVSRYYKAQAASLEVTALRKKLVSELKTRGLTGTKFNFGDKLVQFSTYTDYEGLTKPRIMAAVRQYYPQINAEEFIERLYGSRKRKVVETIKVTSRREKSETQERHNGDRA